MAALQIDDLPAAIRQAKRELRERLPNYREVFAEVEKAISEEARLSQSDATGAKPSFPRSSFPTSPNSASGRRRSNS
jgi:hypothetical protein